MTALSCTRRLRAQLLGALFVVAAGVTLAPADGVAAPRHDEIVDCNAVDCYQRAECNRRILAALNDIRQRFVAEETGQHVHEFLSIQRDVQDRLRSFVAPKCQPKGSSNNGRMALGSSAVDDAVNRSFRKWWEKSNPVVAKSWWPLPPWALGMDFDNDGHRQRLKGRWEGWISLYDARGPISIWLQVTEVDPQGYVRACTDQGMVMGNLLEKQKPSDTAILQLPRRDKLAFGTRMLLWRGPPHHDDLEGVVIFERDSGEWRERGLVWLSRVINSADDPPLTDYPCQDPEILDRRNAPWIPWPR